MIRIGTVLLCVLCTALVTAEAPRVVLPATTPSDSVLAELRVGRYWHAARLLREAGADTAGPADVLLLARAEAGWRNWPAVTALLEGAEWLDLEDEGGAWFLLGRALEAEGRWQPASEAYGQFLLAGSERARGERIAALARRARALDRLGDADAALGALDAIADATVASWTAVELARGAAEADTARVLDLLARVEVPGAAWTARRLETDVRLAAGDTAGAAASLREALGGPGGRRVASAAVKLGVLELALGDTAEAERLLLSGLDGTSRGDAGDAAAALFDLIGQDDAEFTLRLARALDRVGNGRLGLMAYERAAALTEADGGALPEWARLERARLMATIRSRQNEALEEFRAIRETTEDARIGARNIEVWTQMRRRQGMTPQVNTLRRWLLEEHPRSPQAAELLWSRGSSAESRGDLDGALEYYQAVASSARTHPRAGQARMRTGQIHLGREDWAEAARVFDAYLADFPNGRRSDEASYWSARVHIELGDTTKAVERVYRIRAQDALSYYTVMGDELLGRAYEVAVPEGEVPVEPRWLTEGLRGLDLLGAAGLDEGADAEIEELSRRARGSTGVMLRLAEALIERGRTIAGIEVGWQLRADGQPWDRRLVEVVFPFPYRELVAREAEEWGVDPLLVAAMIRQESAFEAGIISRAGAVGLMQVMPATGSSLARTHGVVGFREASLATADVNLHLGAAYFAEMSRRFSDLPLALTAYNAGPTRARRWSRLPEASDPERFTEFIPIVETRGYVKSVRRNLALYRALYGDR